MDAERGFPKDEFRSRTARAQALMSNSDLTAILLTTEADVRYYTGFLTRFWESPTRPWFVVVPVAGDPIAVIPQIGRDLMARTWVRDIRTWNAPDYSDDGVGLLADTLREVVPVGGKIGVPAHLESHVRMPLSDFNALQGSLNDRLVVSDRKITRSVRLIKSERELAKIKRAVGIADRAFARVSDIAAPGVPLSAVFRNFQRLCLEEGADWVPYLAGAAEEGGYGGVISPADDTPLADRDLLMLDTGLVWDGYFCDFNRNYSLSPPTKAVSEAHTRLIEATEAAFEIARPGQTVARLFHAMNAVLGLGEETGRLGHGLGMQLTEAPSILPEDATVLEPGMVMTLEPYVKTGPGKIMVHEENIVIGDKAAEYLTPPEGKELRVLC
ncbi:MAG: Xaa-Pro peptidase family protein [Pseudomonadota bacterium]